MFVLTAEPVGRAPQVCPVWGPEEQSQEKPGQLLWKPHTGEWFWFTLSLYWWTPCLVVSSSLCGTAQHPVHCCTAEHPRYMSPSFTLSCTDEHPVWCFPVDCLVLANTLCTCFLLALSSTGELAVWLLVVYSVFCTVGGGHVWLTP